MSEFTSKDFAKVPAQLTARLPERLIHRQVALAAADADFSAERRHPVHLVNLPAKTLSVTLGGIAPAQRTGRHRHNYETILYVTKGRGRTVIEDCVIDWEMGDAVYIPVWAWHHHENRSATESCAYLACENAPLLQNLGSIALREEENAEGATR